jgi:hypothetical protein
MLPRASQVDVVSRFAQLEYAHGAVERARTLFEGLLANHPKRLDQWLVYADMERKHGHTSTCRRVFERVSSLKLPAKQMRAVLKRWLAFEQEYGACATRLSCYMQLIALARCVCVCVFLLLFVLCALVQARPLTRRSYDSARATSLKRRNSDNESHFCSCSRRQSRRVQARRQRAIVRRHAHHIHVDRHHSRKQIRVRIEHLWRLIHDSRREL